MKRAAELALTRYGAEALAYGADAGAGPLLEWLARRIEQREGRAPTSQEIMLTGGNSDALDQVCSFFTSPGDVVLAEDFTYHLAVRILRDHLLEIIPVATDEDGIQVSALQATLNELKHAGRSPRFLYTIPTFHNPTGASLSEARRRGLVKVAAAEHLRIVEDDVYRELGYDGVAPPSLWSLAPDIVLRMGSFAKATAPGLRLGWLTGKAELVHRMVNGGLRDSGGGINHFTAMVMSEFCEQGFFDQQVERLRAAYRTRRDALAEALGGAVPSARFNIPAGGFFIWVALENTDTSTLRARAEAEGVDFIPGTRFALNGGGQNILRVAFTLYPPAELRQAAQRLSRVIENRDGSHEAGS